MLISTADRVIEVHLFDSYDGGGYLGRVLLLFRESLLRRLLLLPFAGVIVGVSEGYTSDVIFRF